MKQLVPVFNKPMISFPLTTLVLASVRDILVITAPEDAPDFRRLLGDGSQFDVNASCAVQEVPDGLVQAFLVGEEFAGGGSVALVLGDNLFYGPRIGSRLNRLTDIDGAAVFAYWVAHPEEGGVVEFDDNSVVDVAKNLEPSARGE